MQIKKKKKKRRTGNEENNRRAERGSATVETSTRKTD